MQFVAAKSAGYNSRTSGAMPSDEKGTFFERPSTVFIQRNGLLMILQVSESTISTPFKHLLKMLDFSLE